MLSVDHPFGLCICGLQYCRVYNNIQCRGSTLFEGFVGGARYVCGHMCSFFLSFYYYHCHGSNTGTGP